MSSKWLKNKEFVWGVIEEILEEDNLIQYTEIVKDEYERIMNIVFRKQLEYNNYTSMNKDILSNINGILNNIKREMNKPSKKKVRIQEVYNKERNQEEPITNEDLRNSRTQEFNNKLEETQRDFNNTMKLKPPTEIDFSDKVEDENENIDKLMEEELKKRSYELNNITQNYQGKKAEEWIYNGNKQVNEEIKHNKEQNNEKNIQNNEKNIQNNEKSIQNNEKNIQNMNEMINLELIDSTDYYSEEIKEKPLKLNNFLSKLKKINKEEQSGKTSSNKEEESGEAISNKENEPSSNKENLLEKTLILENKESSVERKVELLEQENYIKELGIYKLDLDEDYYLKSVIIPNKNIIYKNNYIELSINTNMLKKIDIFINREKYELITEDGIEYIGENNKKLLLSNNTYIKLEVDNNII
jgi:hypothetical protein